MKKLVYPVMLVLFFVFLIGCDRIVEVKEIATVKCRSCGKILESDTTTMKGRYDRDKGTITTSEGRIHHLNYFGPVRKVTDDVTLTLCEECKKNMKKKAEEYLKKGKREYSRGNWIKARDYFENAIMSDYDEYPEADKWLEKVEAKFYYREEKPVKTTYAKPTTTKRKSAGFYERERYAQMLEERASDIRPVVMFQVSKDTELLISQVGITYALAHDYYHIMVIEGRIRQMRELGFTSITFIDLYTLRIYPFVL